MGVAFFMRCTFLKVSALGEKYVNTHKLMVKEFASMQRLYRFALLIRENGLVAEWLGRALQKLVQRFESARDLTL